MDINWVVNQFKHHCPKKVDDVLAFGTTHIGTVKKQIGPIVLQQVGMGSYRRVYKINDLPLVVKFPNGPDGSTEECVEHSLNEMDILTQVGRKPKYEQLRKYLPIVYYHNEYGVILMREYKATPISTNRKICKAASREIEQVLNKEFDLYKNFSINEGGQIILLDWGLLGDLTNWVQA